MSNIITHVKLKRRKQSLYQESKGPNLDKTKGVQQSVIKFVPFNLI